MKREQRVPRGASSAVGRSEQCVPRERLGQWKGVSSVSREQYQVCKESFSVLPASSLMTWRLLINSENSANSLDLFLTNLFSITRCYLSLPSGTSCFLSMFPGVSCTSIFLFSLLSLKVLPAPPA